MKNISYGLFFILLILISGCKQKGEDNSSSSAEKSSHQPTGPQYTANYDRTKPTETIDVESTISTSSEVRLSEVASSIEYFQVGDDKYPVTDVVAVDGGFIALNKPKLYLYRQGKKRKRVGLKTKYSDWKDSNSPGNSLFYDKTTTKLYVQLKKLNPETGYSDKFIVELPPLDSVLARTHYLYADSLPNRYFLQNWGEIFTPEMYIRRFNYSGTGFDYGVTTFNLKNDTLCHFYAGIDSIGTIKDDNFYNFTGLYSTSYLYDNKPTFSATYCDTVYRLSDHRTITPVYNIHLGKYKASANYVINKGDKRNKVWINELRENPKGVFLKVHREGKSNKSGWLDNKDKENRDFPSEDYLMVYLKNKRQTKALPLTSQGITNDLDDGLPFWPDGQTDEYMYMIRSAKDLKQQVKLTGSPKQNTLKNFLSDLPDNQNVMIVVK